MTAVFGVITSLAVGLLVAAVVTNRDDVEYLLKARRRNDHLRGGWHQYHVTHDEKFSPFDFWSRHDEEMNITSFGHVKGLSGGRHETALDYRLTGRIRHGVMRLRLVNITADEEGVMICYPNLLSRDRLVGMWIGLDYDKKWSSGVIILSRNVLNFEELSRTASLQNVLGIPEREFPNVEGVDPESPPT